MQQDTKQLEIGHIIEITGPIHRYYVTITRLTKTMAFGINKWNNEEKFKRSYTSTTWITSLPRVKWSTTNYQLINEKEINKSTETVSSS